MQTTSVGAAGQGRLRTWLIWAGIATLAALSLLAIAHLLSDVAAVFSIRGGLSAVAVRLLPVAILSFAAGAGAIGVAWLAGTGVRGERLAIGFGLAVLVVVRVYLSNQFDSGSLGEPSVYPAMAESLVSGGEGPVGRPAGYAVLLAGAYALIEDRQLAAEVVNLLLAVLAGGVVLGLARGLYGRRAGALALLGYAVWPAGALMTVVSIPQTAFDLAVAASAWAAVATPPGWRGHALTGAVLGLAQYLRPTAPALLPAFILARLWPGGPRRGLWAALLVPVAAFLLVLTPVIWQNLERDGTLSISTSDYGGQTLYLGTYEPSGGTFDEAAMEVLFEQAGPDVRDRSALGTELALQRIREDPIGVAALAVRKQDTLWGTEHFGAQYAIKQSLKDRPQHPRVTTPLLLSQGFYVLVLLSASLGLFLRRHHADALLPLAIVLIWTVAATHALLEVRDRHHSYVIPVLLPIGSMALVTVLAYLRRRLASATGR